MTNATATSLRTNMRKLWSDHVIWTRDYIIAAVDGTSDADPAAKRLLKLLIVFHALLLKSFSECSS